MATSNDEIAALSDMVRCAVDAFGHMLETGMAELRITNDSGKRIIVVTDHRGKEHSFLTGENRHTFARSVWTNN